MYSDKLENRVPDDQIGAVYARTGAQKKLLANLLIAKAFTGDWIAELIVDDVLQNKYYLRERDIEDISNFVVDMLTSTIDSVFTNSICEVVLTPLLGVERDGSADEYYEE